MENTTWSVASMIEETEVMLRSAKEEEVLVAPAPAINPFASSREPLPYDPMLGWYTAATLSGLLILFLACVGLEKVKDKILMTFEKDHQGNAGGGDKALLAGGGGGCDAGQLPRTGRSSNADPKCLAENDALLGRNCVDHNYVYLTLDRPNHVDATTNQSSLPPVSEGHHPTPTPPLPGQPAAGGCPPTMTTRPPTGCREGVEGGEGGVETVPSTTTPSETATAAVEGVRSRGDEVQTTRTTPQSPSKFVAVVQQATTHMHSVKIEIVEVHSESPVHHEEITIDDKDVHESAV